MLYKAVRNRDTLVSEASGSATRLIARLPVSGETLLLVRNAGKRILKMQEDKLQRLVDILKAIEANPIVDKHREELRSLLAR